MTFKDALHILSANVILKVILPGWSKNLTEHNRKIDESVVELKVCYSYLQRVLVGDVPLMSTPPNRIAIHARNGGSS